MNETLSKDILVFELIIKGLISRSICAVVVQGDVQETQRYELHVEVVCHEEVEQLHVWWNVDQG